MTSTAQNQPTATISAARLIPIGTRPRLDTYLGDLWRLREFIGTQARLKALATGRGTILGRVWLILAPFLQVLMFYVIFGLLVKSNRGIDNFIAYLAIGVIFFVPMGASLTRGMGAITGSKGLIRGFSFPRASVIISESITGLINSIPDVLALLLFIIIMPPHVTPHWTWILLVPIIIFRQILITGLMFITARLTTAIPDFNQLWPIFTRFWFYASGVFFSVEHMVSDPTAKLLLLANPAHVVLSSARAVLMDHEIPPLSAWLLLFGWSFLALVIGFISFWQGELEYSRVES